MRLLHEWDWLSVADPKNIFPASRTSAYLRWYCTRIACTRCRPAACALRLLGCTRVETHLRSIQQRCRRRLSIPSSRSTAACSTTVRLTAKNARPTCLRPAVIWRRALHPQGLDAPSLERCGYAPECARIPNPRQHQRSASQRDVRVRPAQSALGSRLSSLPRCRLRRGQGYGSTRTRRGGARLAQTPQGCVQGPEQGESRALVQHKCHEKKRKPYNAGLTCERFSLTLSSRILAWINACVLGSSMPVASAVPA